MTEKPETRDQINKAVTEAIHKERSSTFQYEIKSGFTGLPGLTPEVHIRLTGGDRRELNGLGLAIQRLILEFAERKQNEGAHETAG